MTKYSIFTIIGLILCLFVSCRRISNIREVGIINDTIENNEVLYLPDIYYGNKDIYSLAVGLANVDRSSDSLSYIKWNNRIDSLESHGNLRKLSEAEVLSLLENLTDSIKKYGSGCNASISERSYILYGWKLHIAIQKGMKLVSTINNLELQNLLVKENNAWIGLWTNLAKLIEYEIEQSTGSSAAYDVPINLTKIIDVRNRIIDSDREILTEGKVEEKREVRSGNIEERLIEKINSINTTHYDFDNDKYVNDEEIILVQESTKKSLKNWLNIRDDISKIIDNKNAYRNDTQELMDKVYECLQNIRK